MESDLKVFRLALYMNTGESSKFVGGKAAASPLAYYYHLLKNKKVILGGQIFFNGLGLYHTYVKDFFVENEIVCLPQVIDCDGEKIVISDIGYIYQNRDPLFSYHKNGIYWQSKIDKICKRKTLAENERKLYFLNSYRIGLEEYYDKDNRENGKIKEWKVVVSDLKMLRFPITHESENSKLLSTYRKSNSEKVSGFYSSDRKRTHQYRQCPYQLKLVLLPPTSIFLHQSRPSLLQQ